MSYEIGDIVQANEDAGCDYIRGGDIGTVLSTAGTVSALFVKWLDPKDKTNNGEWWIPTAEVSLIKKGNNNG